jgi:hypothetical protein
MMAFPGPLVQSRAKSCAIALLAALLIAGCASGSGKSKPGEAARILRDQRITRAQLEEASNAFADRYFSLMLAASERVIRGNNDIQQCRIMNGLRLLGVSSMYDIATSPDTVTQLVDQLVVVTLQNYFWVDTGRAQIIWGPRAQYLVENLRRAREDIWTIAARVFTDEQLEELDLSIATWWSRRGGTEFVAYVRFSEVASVKGEALIETIRDGGGLLEPLDRATEQVQNANLALDRAFFWSKRLPLFINWQAEALWYDMLVMPDTQKLLASVDVMSQAIAIVPERMKMVNTTVAGAQDTARDLVDRIFHRVLVVLIVVLVGTFVIMKWRVSRKEAAS